MLSLLRIPWPQDLIHQLRKHISNFFLTVFVRFVDALFSWWRQFWYLHYGQNCLQCFLTYFIFWISMIPHIYCTNYSIHENWNIFYILFPKNAVFWRICFSLHKKWPFFSWKFCFPMTNYFTEWIMILKIISMVRVMNYHCFLQTQWI